MPRIGGSSAIFLSAEPCGGELHGGRLCGGFVFDDAWKAQW